MSAAIRNNMRSVRRAATAALKTTGDADWRRAVRAEIGLVPRTVRILPVLARQLSGRTPTLLHAVRRNARKLPQGLALEMDDTQLSWRELDLLTSRLAFVLAEQGAREGDVVAIMGRNSPLYVALILACTRVGATAALINSHLEEQPLRHAIDAAQASLLLVESDLAARLSASDGPPQLTFGDGQLEAALASAQAANGDGAAEAEYPPARITSDTDFVYIYTSGTTGMPKPCRISHARSTLAGAGFGTLMFDYRSTDKLYCVLPLYHASGLMIGVGACIMMRVPCAMRPVFSASEFWPDIKRYQATAMLYVGELCRYLVNSDTHEDERGNTLRVAVGNGLRPDVWEIFQRRFAVEIREFYTATEAPGFLLNLSGKVGALGRLPFGGLGWMKLARVDAATETYARDAAGFCIECDVDEPGELLVRLGSVSTPATEFRGYTDGAATSKKILTDVFVEGDRYFRSGDLLRRDPSGFFYFLDRLGDTYRWRGENVSTMEVADCITKASCVAQASVVGVRVPGQEGACGLAAIVPDGPLSLHEIERACRALPGYAQPRFLRVVDAMDATGTFKTKTQRLKHEGADPGVVRDPLYVLQGGGYVPLTAELFDGIGRGVVRL